jgi:hypothetical protein
LSDDVVNQLGGPEEPKKLKERRTIAGRKPNKVARKTATRTKVTKTTGRKVVKKTAAKTTSKRAAIKTTAKKITAKKTVAKSKRA